METYGRRREILGEVLTGLRAGRPRNRGSIPGMSKRFFSSPERLDRLWGLLFRVSRG